MKHRTKLGYLKLQEISKYDFLRRKRLVQFVPFMSTDIEDHQLTPAAYLINKESTQDLYVEIKKLKLAYQRSLF